MNVRCVLVRFGKGPVVPEFFSVVNPALIDSERFFRGPLLNIKSANIIKSMPDFRFIIDFLEDGDRTEVMIESFFMISVYMIYSPDIEEGRGYAVFLSNLV